MPELTQEQRDAAKSLKSLLAATLESRSQKAFKDEIIEVVEGKFKETLDTVKDEMVKTLKDEFKPLLTENQATERAEDTFQYGEVDDQPTPRLKMQKMLFSPAKELGAHAELSHTLQKAHDTCIFLAIRKNVSDMRQLSMWQRNFAQNVELQKAINPAPGGTGEDWLMTMMSSDFIERLEDNYDVLNMLPPERRITVPMGVRSMDIPGAGNEFEVSRLGTTDSDTWPGTAAAKVTPAARKITVTPVKFAVQVLIEEEEIEDAAFDVIQQAVLPEIDLSVARGMDSGAINGDSDGTHMDSDITGSTDRRTAWDGIRKQANTAGAETALGDADVQVSATANNIATLFSTMRNGNRVYNQKDDLVLIFPHTAWWNMFTVDALLTEQNFGNRALITRGDFDAVMGVPVTRSTQVREDLNALGVYDGAVIDRTEVLAFNRRAWTYAIKRGVTVKSEELIDEDRRRVVMTLRSRFISRHESTEPCAAALIDVNT